MKVKQLVNIGLKVIIITLALHVFLFPELEQYQEKGMKYRLIGYPTAALSIFIFRLMSKNKVSPYPYTLDILLSLIISIDMLGNALGLYGSVEWWDDIMHLFNSSILTVVVFLILKSIQKINLILWISVFGIMAWLQLAWEMAEYITFITTNHRELNLAYRDTIGDLFFGQLGSLLVFIAYLIINKFRDAHKYQSN